MEENSLDIELNNEYRENGNYYRLTKFRVGSGQFQYPLPALDNSGRIHSAIRQGHEYYPIIENYVKLTLDDLMEKQSNRDKQREFVNRNMVSQENGNLFTFFKILLRDDESITDEHIRYINNLLSSPDNSLVITPLLYRYHYSKTKRIVIDAPVGIDTYFDFAKKFLEIVGDERDEVGLTLPSNIPMSPIPALLKLYRNFKTQFAVIDEAGKTNNDMYLQLRALIGFGDKNSYNLIQKHDENFMLYSLDAKPYRGRKDSVPATNILQYDNGIGAYGPRHTVKMKNDDNSPTQKGSNKTILPKIYNNTDYSYVKAEREDVRNNFLSFLENHDVNTSIPYEKLVKNYKRDYDLMGQIDSTNELNRLVIENELDKTLTNIPAIADEVKRMKKNNKKMVQPAINFDSF